MVDLGGEKVWCHTEKNTGSTCLGSSDTGIFYCLIKKRLQLQTSWLWHFKLSLQFLWTTKWVFGLGTTVSYTVLLYLLNLSLQSKNQKEGRQWWCDCLGVPVDGREGISLQRDAHEASLVETFDEDERRGSFCILGTWVLNSSLCVRNVWAPSLKYETDLWNIERDHADRQSSSF